MLTLNAPGGAIQELKRRSHRRLRREMLTTLTTQVQRPSGTNGTPMKVAWWWNCRAREFLLSKAFPTSPIPRRCSRRAGNEMHLELIHGSTKPKLLLTAFLLIALALNLLACNRGSYGSSQRSTATAAPT